MENLDKIGYAFEITYVNLAETHLTAADKHYKQWLAAIAELKTSEAAIQRAQFIKSLYLFESTQFHVTDTEKQQTGEDKPQSNGI